VNVLSGPEFVSDISMHRTIVKLIFNAEFDNNLKVGP